MKTVQRLAITIVIGGYLWPLSCAAQFDTIYRFGGSPDGAAPQGLVAGPRGVLYGTTAYGGAMGYGTVFQLTAPAGPGQKWTETLLYEFTDPNDGTNPFAPLVVGKDGTLFGTTGGVGTIFELQPPSAPGGTWIETVLYRSEGEGGYSGFNRGLVIGPNGELYGASEGGFYNCGVVFGFTPPSVPGKWAVSMQYDLPCDAGGSGPQGLAISPDGVLYGTTAYGGSSGQGTVFALTPSPVPGVWTETVLYNFTGGADGGLPSQPPVIAPGEDLELVPSLYGTTTAGGTYGMGTIFEVGPPESPGGNWVESVLYSFGSLSGGDGRIPDSPLIVGNGTICGTTATGTIGANSGGSVFDIYRSNEVDWFEVPLHNFGGPAGPAGTLVMDKSGVIYGTTVGGPGPDGVGTVYKIKP